MGRECGGEVWRGASGYSGPLVFAAVVLCVCVWRSFGECWEMRRGALGCLAGFFWWGDECLRCLFCRVWLGWRRFTYNFFLAEMMKG